MSEIECTAARYEADQANVLFVPPCSCPKCAAKADEFGSGAGSWLRVSGRQQRFRVAAVVLGEDGQAVLG